MTFTHKVADFILSHCSEILKHEVVVVDVVDVVPWPDKKVSKKT
jgi:hypothetical protein